MTSDSTTALLRAIGADAVDTVFVVDGVRSRNWASATFVGTRHEIGLRFDGDGAAAAADRFLDCLGEREFDLRDHLLADIRLVAREDCRAPNGELQVRISIEALTVEGD